MEPWLVLSVMVVVLWGLWGLALKYASLNLEWQYVYVASALGAFLVYATVVLALALTGKLGHVSDYKSLGIALLGGLMGALGGLMLIIALRLAEASIVVPLTSIYPAVTVALSIALLGESVTTRKIAGVILAIIAVILLSTSD
ncbi:MAG: EamA family transporter [Desulfurococcales archaeon]|nr:EamA family transporter [Desulfurococcaceae archaeon]MCC6059964.1 EamA family transporter [Desulfurococcaceae archaeon]MDT7865687.1 EamA family transporter [Desulfurococcales archaeon]